MTEEMQPRHRTRSTNGDEQQAQGVTPTQSPPQANTGPIQPTGPAPITGPQASQQPQRGWMHTGAEAEQLRARELAEIERRRSQNYIPRRFWLRVGGRADIILLDNQPGPCFYEHNLPDPQNQNRRTLFELCPAEYDHCPLCQRGERNYYVQFYTIVDLSQYTNKKGELVRYTRRLLAVKASQQERYARLYQRWGNLRGIHLVVHRDSQNAAAIGDPEYHTSYSEDQLLQAFQHSQVLGQNGKVLKQANADCYPFDYEALFTRPSGDALRARYGGTAPAGSHMETQQVWGQQPVQQQQGWVQPAGGQAVPPPIQATQPQQAAQQPVQQAAQQQPQQIAPATTNGQQPQQQPQQAQQQVSGHIGGIAPTTTPASWNDASDLDDEIPF